MAKKLQKLINIFCWVPFVISFAGYFYMDGGEGVDALSAWEAVYASLALYFINPVADNQNFLIMTGKFLSLIVTTSVLLSAITFFMGSFSKWWKRHYKDSAAIYTDCELGKTVCAGCKHGFISDNADDGSLEFEKTNNHFLIFSDDKKAVKLLNSADDLPTDKNVYVLLNEIDTGLLNSKKHNIHYFNINDIIAREYWKQYNLYDDIKGEDKRFKIAILGFDPIGKHIFKQAFLSNIYDLDQSIEYHIWGADPFYKDFLNGLNCANNDKIVIHEGDWINEVSEIIKADRVIVTAENDINAIQILIGASPTLKIHAFSREGDAFAKIFENDNIRSFGDISLVLNEKTIKSEQTYLLAKLFNYDYHVSFGGGEFKEDYESEMESLWQELSPFKRSSSVARADFYWIEKRKKEEGTPEEKIWEMEHIRWCRFHYISFWHYGAEKSEKNRTHPLLVDFKDLPYSEQKKDGITCKHLEEVIDKLI